MNEGLQPFLDALPKYLTLHGLTLRTNTSGRCPIKEHKSAYPFRMGIGRGGDPVWHCFACEQGGDIFDLATHLYGFPSGKEPGFYDITVRHLSDSLGIPFPDVKIVRTEKQQHAQLLYGAVREIANNLSILPVKEYATKRGWNKDLLKKYNVGGISNYDSLLKQLLKNYSDQVLQEIGFLSKYTPMFAEDRIIFTIHDTAGRPVGFTGRLMNVGSHAPRKYVNSPGSVIFSKRDLFYNYHRAKMNYVKHRCKVMYIVEGQADVLTLASKGIKAVVAASGIAFTDTHAKLLEDFDLCVACFDADNGGMQGTRKLYTKYKGIVGSDLYLLQLPMGADPDEYVKEHGAEAFAGLDPMLPIEWEILNEYSVKGMLLANYWLPKIANMNSLYHQRVLTMLSNKTGISFSDLNQRLQTLIRVEVRKLMVADLLSGNVNITVETK